MLEILFKLLKINRDVSEWYNHNNLVQASSGCIAPYIR
jgi:hypothetical protein